MTNNKQLKILFIPGWGGSDLDYESNDVFLRPYLESYSLHRGLEFELDIFLWPVGINRPNPLNLFKSIHLYFILLQLVKTLHIINALVKHLQEYKPDVIICHSLGAMLFAEAVRYVDNSFFKGIKVIFLSAHVTKCGIKSVLLKDINLINFYCPWDELLLIVWFFRFKLNIGLTGFFIDGVRNRFLLLHKSMLLHNSVFKHRKVMCEIFD